MNIKIFPMILCVMSVFTLSACAELKHSGKAIGHATKDAGKAIGHATRDTAKSIKKTLK